MKRSSSIFSWCYLSFANLRSMGLEVIALARIMPIVSKTPTNHNRFYRSRHFPHRFATTCCWGEIWSPKTMDEVLTMTVSCVVASRCSKEKTWPLLFTPVLSLRYIILDSNRYFFSMFIFGRQWLIVGLWLAILAKGLWTLHRECNQSSI